MELTDWLTVALVLVGVWTFVPRRYRRALYAGLSPAIVALLDTLHDGATILRKVVTHVAYRGLLGVPVPGEITVKPEEDEDETEDVALTATKTQDNNNPIATPTTDSNALLFQNTAANLALAVKAGKMGETEGIKLYFGVSPSSSNPRYIAARAALKAELAKLDPPKFRRTPEQENARDALGLNKAT